MDFVDPFNQTLIPSIKYYHKFRLIHQILVRITTPYIFIVGFVGLITNTFTILLLSTSCVTKNLKHKWTLISLGELSEGQCQVDRFSCQRTNKSQEFSY